MLMLKSNRLRYELYTLSPTAILLRKKENVCDIIVDARVTSSTDISFFK